METVRHYRLDIHIIGNRVLRHTGSVLLELFLSSYFKITSIDVSTIADLYAEADNALFKRLLTNESHVLRALLPDKSSRGYNLRNSSP